MLAIVAGFFGVLLVMHPGIGTVHWAMLLALVATLGYALYNLATRYLAAFDPAAVTQTYTPLAGVLVLAPFAIAAWQTPKTCASMAAARLARLLGRARPLAADPRPSQRAGRRARAVHLSRADLDVGAGLSRVRRRADLVDAVGRGHRHRVGTLSLGARAEAVGEAKGGPASDIATQ